MQFDLISFRPEESRQPRVESSAATRRVDVHRLDLVVQVQLEEGVHLYAHPAPEGFEPLTVEVLAPEGVSVGSPSYPAPQALLGGAPVYKGAIEIVVPVRFSAADQLHGLEARISYQACTNDRCFLPAVELLPIPEP